MAETPDEAAKEVKEFQSESFLDGVKIEPAKEPEKEAPASEPEKKAVEKTPEPEAAEDDAEEPEAAEDADEDSADEDKPKKSQRQHFRALRLRAERAERELETLKRPPADKKPLTQEKIPNKDTRDARPRLEDYAAQDFEKFEDDLLEWKLRDRDEKAEKARETTRQQEAVAEHTQKLKTDSAALFEKAIESGKYEDFVEKVIEGGQAGDYDLSDEVFELAIYSDVGEDILYHLATHPKEASKMHSLSPMARAAAFGRLEAKFAAPAETTQKPEPKPTLKAPLKNQPRGAGGKFKPDYSSNDFAAVEAAWNKEHGN